MADAVRLLARIRELGANVVLTHGKLRVVNDHKLPAGAMDFIKASRDEIMATLRAELEADFDERAAIIEFEGRAPREWAEQFAALLISRRPANVANYDWQRFIDTCGAIIDGSGLRGAA